MSEQELLQAMAQAYRQQPAMVPEFAMLAVLDVLHKAGYRRCAEEQRTTQWCERAEKAEAEVERLRADAERYLWLIENINPADAGLPHPIDYWNTKDPVWKQQIDAAIDKARRG